MVPQAYFPRLSPAHYVGKSPAVEDQSIPLTALVKGNDAGTLELPPTSARCGASAGIGGN